MSEVKSFIGIGNDRLKSIIGVPVDRTKVILGSLLNPLPSDVLMYNNEPLSYETEYLTY